MRDGHVRDETARALVAAGLDVVATQTTIRRALDEDLRDIGDITSAATVHEHARMVASYVTRGDGVAAGLPVLAAAFDLVAGDSARLECLVADGARVTSGDVLAIVEAPARLVLTAERTTLNLLGHLCGVATATRQWVDAVAGTPARIRDTRKTIPGLRDLDKYAVRCGGGVNHRRGLFDAYLVKDNHAAAAGGVAAALSLVEAHQRDGAAVQVEVDDLDQLLEVLPHRPPSILLDNFDTDQLVAAVRLIRTESPTTAIEASGGLTLDRAAEVARTGVDYLAVGAITHSAAQLDIGLDVGLGVGGAAPLPAGVSARAAAGS